MKDKKEIPPSVLTSLKEHSKKTKIPEDALLEFAWFDFIETYDYMKKG